MPFRYEVSPDGGPLQQGELLGNIVVHSAQYPPIEVPKGTEIDTLSTRHPYVVVMNQDCDLEWDFMARYPTVDFQEQYQPAEVIEKPHALVPQVLICDAYIEARLRGKEGRVGNSESWKLVKANRDKRYHRLPAADVGDDEAELLPDIFLDFKKTLTVPTEWMYKGLEAGAINRIARIPSIYRYDLIQRFYQYHSRVALPDQ